MTDETFTELVNLYLDEEISGEDLARLKEALSVSARRKEVFVERKRLHKAMQLALNPSENPSEVVAAQTSSGGDGRAAFPFRWFLGTGIAASLVIGALFFLPFSLDREKLGSPTGDVELASASAADFLEQALSKWGSDAELKRYASRQEKGLANERASLAAQLRLMGLRPELTPSDKELRAVNLAELESKPRRSQAELLTALQRHSVMPEARILRYDVKAGNPVESERQAYSGGFQSSLTSFR
jgi:hypothetical protein